MEYDIEKQDVVDRYVRGEMTYKEERNFKAEMDKSPELMEEVLLEMSISDNICSMADKKRKMRQWEHDITARKNKKIWLVSTVAGIAACFIVALILLVPMRRYGQGMITFTGNHGAECGTSVPVDTMQGIFTSIEKGKYRQALNSIDRLLLMQDLNKNDIYSLTWLRIHVFIGAGRIEEAVIQLRDLKKEKGRYAGEAENVLRQLEEQLQYRRDTVKAVMP
ncbi:hypothetical protein [Xylanibacter muris]|uniref:Tetratricopeptide repeat protein n=1 Tax=Xylanibacter muris TaxID=2736290 RepID=A0ABX2AKV0_9BACT|nr:hypothetical protein [Xylanibacter muris]NPD91833.1 hypothetical protein [Xylanibacter muris]